MHIVQASVSRRREQAMAGIVERVIRLNAAAKGGKRPDAIVVGRRAAKELLRSGARLTGKPCQKLKSGHVGFFMRVPITYDPKLGRDEVTILVNRTT